MNPTPIDGYADIHDNVRYWLALLLEGRDGALYDIGANDGILSVPFAAVGRPVVAFEPGGAARRRLGQRAREAGVSVSDASGEAASGDDDASGSEAAPIGVPQPAAGVTIVPVALADRSGTAELTVYSDDTFASLHTRSEAERERYHLAHAATESVALEPLDDLAPRVHLPDPVVCKVDVEGGELAVFRGARRLLSRLLPPLLFEYSCINTANAGYERAELLTELRSIGYRYLWGLYRNEDRRLYGGAALDDCRIWNVIALAAEDPAVELAREHLAGEVLPRSTNATT